jgi:hypothetical protein
VDRQHGVGTSGVGEKVVVDEHVDVCLVIKQQTLGILCGHRDASRVECDTGLVRFGPRLSAAVVAIGSLRVAGAVLSVLRASGLVGLLAGAATGEARDVLLLMLPFLCEGDAAISSVGLIAEVDAGHAIAPTPR